MGKKKTNEGAAKGKQGKKEKMPVSALLASLDQKPDKPKKETSSSSTTRKPRHKSAPMLQSYADIDLSPSDDDDDDVDVTDFSTEDESQSEGSKKSNRKQRANDNVLEISVTDKELQKCKKKEMLVAHALEQAKQEALKDDHDAFTVVIGARALVLDGQDDANANVKDITVDNFSVSARGKELLKNASVKIFHGKRYGLVGPNGKGKFTLLKLLAWRKIPVPKNIDVVLVEQEIVGDDRTAIEVVVSANEELIRLRKEVASLMNEDEDETDADTVNKLSELYYRLQIMGSDSAEARASKILAGLGFTTGMQSQTT